ncbi:MAG: FHA domain-containing protein [Deltaproteobacteria bacterium]|nr:FHA domain-containing protein [Deltaproteobacteria bacterium]
MPVTVAVKSASKSTGAAAADDAPSLTFDGTRVVIGRGSGSDVRLPDPSVSFRHATIRAGQGGGSDYAIVDEGSTNGTWVGGVRLHPQSPRIVRSGDLVRVGRVWLELTIGHRPATPDLGLATRDLAFALVQRAMDAVGDDTTTKVRIAEGPDLGAELALVEDGRVYVLGRAEGCDLPLADPDASREHVQVVRRGAQVLVRDLDSRNGAWLGEQRLTPGKDVTWRSPTMLRVGVSVLALDEPVGAALAELEAAEDEALREEDVPAPPGPPPAAAPPAATSTASADAKPAPAGSEHEDAGPPPSQAAAAPIVSLGDPVEAERPRAAPKRAWTATDFLVVTIAVGVIGASIAGLVWVLR